MFSQTYEIGPYKPGLNAEQSGKASQALAVHDGKNYIWTRRGVQSAFGATYESPSLPLAMDHPGEFLVENQKYFFQQDGVWQIDEITDTWISVFTFALDQLSATYDLEAYEWSMAYVGTRYWFSHPRSSALIYYDKFDDEWGTFRSELWNGPIFGITHADNRLIVLLTDAVAWSMFDRGDQWDIDYRKGSGLQSLAKIQYGQPYAVMPYNGGFVTFTSKGIMASAPYYGQTQDPDGRKLNVGVVVFTHTDAGAENLPLGPTAITHIGERQVIWLSQSGFWQFAGTQGGGFGAVQIWQPEMGRFYAETIIPAAMRRGMMLDEFKLTWSPDLQWLFTSSRAAADGEYPRAHIHQLILDRWCSFNVPHLSVMSGREDVEVSAQRFALRQLGIRDLSGKYIRLDTQANDANSWVKFTPMRLQAPNEDVPAEMMTSVQGLRIGHSHPDYETPEQGDLQSSFAEAEDDEHVSSVFKVFIASADGADQPEKDENAYGVPVHLNKKVSQFSLHTTGVTHTLFITALDDGEAFDIQHIEISYFYAGIK